MNTADKKKMATPAQSFSIDEARSLVRRALENEEFDWRTAEGIATETGLPIPFVRGILADLGSEVIQSSRPDGEGHPLFTLRERYNRTRGLGARLMASLSDQVR